MLFRSASFDQANAAFNKANSALANATGTFSGELTITGNTRIGLTSIPSVNTKLYVLGSAAGSIETLTDAATITPDFSSNNNFTVTINDNRTIANPTNITTGQSGILYVVQGIGSNTISWGSYWKFPSGTAPTLSTSVNSVDAIVYVVRNTTSITAQALLNIG